MAVDVTLAYTNGDGETVERHETANRFATHGGELSIIRDASKGSDLVAVYAPTKWNSVVLVTDGD